MTALGTLLGEHGLLRRRRRGSGGVRRTVTFPTTNLVSRVQVALGADLSADPSTWNWLDISRRIRFDLGVTLTTGRRDEQSTVTAGTATMKLDNRDGYFTRRNPSSPYYGLLSKNTPIWATVDAGSGEKTRLEMFVNEWPTSWSDKSATDSTVTIQCAGILRRLQQGKVLMSAMRRFYTNVSPQPIGYWALESGDQRPATSFDSTLTGGSPLVVAQSTLFGVTRPFSAASGVTPGPAGSAGATDTHAGGYLQGPVTLVSSATTMRGEMAMLADGFENTFPILMQLRRVGISYIGVGTQDIGGLGHQLGVIWNGAVVGNSYTGSPSGIQDNQYHFVQLDASSAGGGADTSYVLRVDGVVVLSGTVAGLTWYPLDRLDVNALAVDIDRVAHLAVWSGTSLPDPALSYDAFLGHSGERAHTRIARLCSEEGIAYQSQATTSTTMGAQSAGTLLSQIREAEAADGGVIYEKRWGLAYQSRTERYNQPVSMALDFAQGHIAEIPAPADDDQRTRNKITVRRTSGDEFTAEQTTGPMGTGTEGPGVYDDSVTLNLGPDEELADHANWRLNLGTVDEDRWPFLALNFTASPELIDTWTALAYGSRLTGANPRPTIPFDPLDQIIEGHSERWDTRLWTAQLNCSPASPYQIAIVSDPATIQEVPRIGSTTATLAAGISSSDTSLSVTTGADGLWTTDVADFPLDINVGGERIRLSAIAGAASPQTFTVSVRSVNSIVKAQSAGTSVAPWKTARVGL